MDGEPKDFSPRRFSRRTVLKGAGALGAVFITGGITGYKIGERGSSVPVKVPTTDVSEETKFIPEYYQPDASEIIPKLDPELLNLYPEMEGKPFQHIRAGKLDIYNFNK